MKIILSAFKQFIKNIWGDYMLAACLFSPLLMGAVFKLAIPRLELILCGYFNKTAVLAMYYPLLDLLLSMMIPLMLCFAGVMVMLEEMDDGTAKYLMVTPLGQAGYLLTRIGLLNMLSIGYSLLVMTAFALTSMRLYQLCLMAVLNSAIAIITAMIVVSFAQNKMEGMALIKLSNFMILGFLAAFFVKEPIGFVSGILPSFWVGKMIFDKNISFMVPGILVSLVWIRLLYRRFYQRVYH